jgi:hypothetical protein
VQADQDNNGNDAHDIRDGPGVYAHQAGHYKSRPFGYYARRDQGLFYCNPFLFKVFHGTGMIGNRQALYSGGQIEILD